MRQQANFIAVFFAKLLFLAWLVPAQSYAADGQLNIYVYHLNERAQVQYRSAPGLNRINQLFRSRDSNTQIAIDPKLLTLLDQIEDHFGVRQVEIICGHRTQAFNKELKETGHHVAGESLHIRGMAADIHLDEITEEALRDYALSLKAGGVGYYPSLNMVHVDVGPVRTWEEPAPRKAWVGESNPQAPVTLTVTPDRTLDKKLAQLRIEPKAAAVSLESKIDLDFFQEGTWHTVTNFSLPSLGCSTIFNHSETVSLSSLHEVLEKLPYGKYRLKVSLCSPQTGSQYSNEFYLKRI